MNADDYITQINDRLQANDRDSAQIACQLAMDDHPSDARFPSVMASLRQMASDIPGSLVHLKKAVELDPNRISARNNYGLALSYTGDFDLAEEQFRAAIAVDPSFAPAYFNLSQIIKPTSGEAIFDRLEAMKKEAGQSDVDLSLIGFTLGKFYDDIGEWDRAFENFAAANRLMDVEYDATQTPGYFAETKRVFTADLINAHRDYAHTDNRPVFIVGMPRSGSSLVEELLARLPGVAGLGEREDMSYLIDAIANQFGPFPACLNSIQPGTLGPVGGRYLEIVENLAPEANRLVDKNLLHFQAAGLIRMLLSNATIIHTRRDPIDTCLSSYFQRFNRAFEFTFDLTHMGHEYAAYADLMDHWAKVMPEDIVTIDYEDTIKDRDATYLRIAQAIGVSPEGADMNAAVDRTVTTASLWQARQPIYDTSLQRWRNYEKHLGPLFDALEESGFHYDPG